MDIIREYDYDGIGCQICNCLDEVLPYLPFPPEDTAASSEKMPKALSPSVFSSVVAQALQAMAKVLKNAFSIPGSMVRETPLLSLSLYLSSSFTTTYKKRRREREEQRRSSLLLPDL